MKLIEGSTTPTILANQMAVGQVARVVGNSAYEDHIVLRAWNLLVSLTNPGTVWSNPGAVVLQVQPFPAGAKLTFEV